MLRTLGVAPGQAEERLQASLARRRTKRNTDATTAVEPLGQSDHTGSTGFNPAHDEQPPDPSTHPPPPRRKRNLQQQPEQLGIRTSISSTSTNSTNTNNYNSINSNNASAENMTNEPNITSNISVNYTSPNLLIDNNPNKINNSNVSSVCENLNNDYCNRDTNTSKSITDNNRSDNTNNNNNGSVTNTHNNSEAVLHINICSSIANTSNEPAPENVTPVCCTHAITSSGVWRAVKCRSCSKYFHCRERCSIRSVSEKQISGANSWECWQCHGVSKNIKNVAP